MPVISREQHPLASQASSKISVMEIDEASLSK
jgi:hypothetical protein